MSLECHGFAVQLDEHGEVLATKVGRQLEPPQQRIPQQQHFLTRAQRIGVIEQLLGVETTDKGTR